MIIYMVWLDRFRHCLLRVTSKEEAAQHIAKALESGEWPHCSLGYEVKVYDELPTRKELE